MSEAIKKDDDDEISLNADDIQVSDS